MFRALLIAMLVVLAAYTGVVMAEHGANLVPPFFAPMLEMTWQGQFNLDFLMFLTLSSLWTAWRGGFSGAALGLGALALFFGILFLTIYLLILLRWTGGDLRRVLLGVHAT